MSAKRPEHLGGFDEQQLAELIALLPPAPAGWVQAAQLLPSTRQTIDELVERAEHDVRARAAVLADLERAISEAGIESGPAAIEYLRTRLQR
jgi:hypothetical protein